MPGADDCWTDHHLLVSRFNIQIRRPPKRISANIPHLQFDCDKLRDPQTSQSFREAIDKNLNKLDLPTNASVEDRWITLRDAMSAAVKETIGFKRKKNQDWFHEVDQTITSVIEVKRHARLAFENNSSAENKRNYQQANAACQRGIREVQKTWWQQKSENLQKYADQRDIRRFYAATKEIFEPTRSSVGSLKMQMAPPSRTPKESLTAGSPILRVY